VRNAFAMEMTCFGNDHHNTHHKCHNTHNIKENDHLQNRESAFAEREHCKAMQRSLIDNNKVFSAKKPLQISKECIVESSMMR